MNLSDCLSSQKRWEVISSISWVLCILVVASTIAMYAKRKRALEQIQADYSNLRRYVLTDGEQAARLNQHVVWLEDQLGSLEGVLRATQDRERQLAEYIRARDMHELNVEERHQGDDGREASLFVVGPDEDSESDDGHEEKNNGGNMEQQGSFGDGLGKSSTLSQSGWKSDPDPYGGTDRHQKAIPNFGAKLSSARLPAPGPQRSESPLYRVLDCTTPHSRPRRPLSPEVESELYASVRSIVEAEEAKSSVSELGDIDEVAEHLRGAETNKDGFVEVVDTLSSVKPRPPFPFVSDVEVDDEDGKTGRKTSWTTGEWEMLEMEGVKGSLGEDGKGGEGDVKY
jgi:hypothetical protein